MTSAVLALLTASFSQAHAEEPRARVARAPVPLDGVAAIVDDVFIFRSDVEARAKHFLDKLSRDPVKRRGERVELDKQILNRLIDEILVTKDATKLHITATDAEVAAGIDSVAQGNKIDRKALEKEVAKAGYSLVEYQEEIRRQVLEQKWLLLRTSGKVDRKLAADPATFASLMEKQHEQLIAELRANSFLEIR